jgi:hypothetical protein
VKKLRRAPAVHDDRRFRVMEYKHGHGHVLLRGGADLEGQGPGGEPGRLRVLDVLFVGPVRVSCSTEFSGLRLREATPEERAEILRRAGRHSDPPEFYLLGDGIQNHICAYSVRWGEFDIHGGDRSPLLGSEEDQALHSPVGGASYFWP